MSNIHFHYFLQRAHLFHDNKVQRLCTIWGHVSNVVNKNNFVGLFVYLDFIWIENFDIDHTIEKVVLTIFDINFS